MMMLPPDPLFVIYSDNPVSCVAISQTSQRLYLGGLDGSVKIWNLATYREISEIKAGSEGIISLQVAGDPEVLILHDKSGMISLWTQQQQDDANSWTKCWSEATDFMGFCQCRLLNDVLIAPLASAALVYFSVPAGDQLQTNSLWGKNISGELMAFEAYEKNNEKMVVVASEANQIGVWSWDGTELGDSLKVEECPMALAFDALRMRGASAGPEGVITIFNVTASGPAMYKIVKVSCPGIASLSIRPDKKILAVGCWDGRLRLLSWKSFVNLATLTMHDNTVQAVTFSDKAPYILAAGCKDGRISIWDIYNDKR